MRTLEHVSAAVLDTHAWVWVSAGISKGKELQDFKGTGVISAISVWEVGMLSQKKRLKLLPDLDTWVQSNLEPPIELEPISPAICLASTRLIGFHGDPADRLIVATAQVLGIPLVTADRSIIDWNSHNACIQVIPI